DIEKINFSLEKGYWKDLTGSAENINITAEQDGYAMSFTASNTYVIADESLIKQNSSDTIQFISMDVKTSSTSPIEIYTNYQDDKNYSYLYLVQGGTSYYQYYNVVNGVSTRTVAKSNIPSSTYNFRDYVTIFINMIVPGETTVSFYQKNAEGELTKRVEFTSASVTPAKQLVVGSKQANSTTIKNLKIHSANSDDYTSVFKECNKFKTKYEELSRVDKATYTANYNSVLDSFYLEYNALSATSRYNLIALKMHVDSLKAIVPTAPAAIPETTKLEDMPKAPDWTETNGYRYFSDNFENGISNWIDATANDSQITTVYDDKLNSNVLKVYGTHYDESGATLKSILNPSGAQIKKIEYKVKFDKMPDAKQVGPKLIYSYTDSAHYNVFQYFYWPDTQTGALAYRWYKYENGATSAIMQNLYNTNQPQLDTWFDVQIFYVGGTATVTMTWNKGQGKGVEKNIIFNCAQADPVEASVMLVANMNGATQGAAYYDDVSVTYEKARIDEDTYVNNDIIVYYTGNTAQYADDVVTVTGEDLYENVSFIEIAPVANDTNDTQAGGYVKQMNEFDLGKEGKYTSSSEHTFDEEKSKKTAILQPDEDSFKFVIPASFENGIYALKLNGYNNDYKVIYINRPIIEHFQGDEGNIATPGGYIQLMGENLALSENDGFDGGKVKVQLKNSAGATIFYEEDIEVLSAYSIKIPIPADFKTGDYEIMVYNGFGDGTCWSQPFSVKIGDSPRSSWNKTIYNIRDYGATGELDCNATPAFVNALSDIAKNENGGVLYIPTGQYIILHTLIIPEKVTLMGDGQDESIVLFIPDQWDFGEMPKSMFYATSNIEVKDLGFYGTRMPATFTFMNETDPNKTNENIYIHDCTLYADPFTADASDGNVNPTRLLKGAELRALIAAEKSGYLFKLGQTKKNAKNVRIYNNWMFREGTTQQMGWGYDIRA
ncbi:MAG: hypothetical protein II201_02845, partial [Clostridia bacterium]|nr:hypothetical protein [Clostridia bacterium]